MKAAILAIPTKKTEDINWVKPLNKYLLSVYGDSSEFQEDIKRLNKLRQDIRGAHADDVGIGLYMRYFSYLELLDLRVPMDVVNKHKSLKFTWYDAFNTSTLHEQYALPFEKASILFNLGSLMTKAASINYKISQRGTGGDEGAFKKALHLMQQAAGMLKYLSENFLHGPSNDLNPATVNFLISLCLAQSQEMFTLRVIDGDLEQKKNTMIAKLCASTARYYDDCEKVIKHLSTPEGLAAVSTHSTIALTESDNDDLLSDEDVIDSEYNPDKSGIPDSKVPAQLDTFWISTIQIKAMYYKSLSNYFYGLHLESNSKFGEAIAYISKSSELLNIIPSATLRAISKTGAEEAYELLDNYKYQKDVLEIKLTDLGKDNDLIYHDPIPNIATIADVTPLDSAKIISISQIEAFSEVNEHSYQNFLCNVVPINVHELLSYYSEEKSLLLRAELDENDVAAEKLASVLESLKLPKSLVIVKELIQKDDQLQGKPYNPESSLSPEILGKVNEISSSYVADIENRREIGQKRDQVVKLVSACQQKIDRLLFLAASEKFRSDLINVKKNLVDVANSDSRLFELVDGAQSQLFQILGQGANSEQFKSLFSVHSSKETNYSLANEISLLDIDDRLVKNELSSVMSQIKTVEDILNDLNVLKADREKLVATLKEHIHKDDISDIIMLNSKVKSTNEIKSEIFPDELKKFDAYLKKLDVLTGKQDSLITELQKAWQKLTSNPKVKEVQTLSDFTSNLVDEQVRRINQFYDNAWVKYTAGLKRGKDIYGNLLGFVEGLSSAIEAEERRNQVLGSFRPHEQSQPSTLYQRVPDSKFDGPPIPPRVTEGYRANSINHPEWSPSHGYSAAVQPHGPGPNMQGRPALTQNALRPQQQDGEGLIYDNPSAYQPNMYDFFLKN